MTSEKGYVIDIQGETVETLEEHDKKIIAHLANIMRKELFCLLIDKVFEKYEEDIKNGIGKG